MIQGSTAGRAKASAVITRIAVLFSLLVFGHTPVIQALTAPPPHTAYLPIISSDDPYGLVPGIWSHGAEPQAHEVSLFRFRWNVNVGFTKLKLQVFADTRYEIYLNGAFIGRGPARFSKWTHEFDVFDVPALNAGEQVLAALVQWSPNTRRSESVRPMFKTRLVVGTQTVAQTDATWKAMLSPAWKAEAVPVHTWQLIGATELLDLNQLPANWMQPGFDDSSWTNATIQPRQQVKNRPRSIPMLVDVPMPATLFSSGRLAPDSSLIELQPDSQGRSVLIMDVPGKSRLTLRTLAQSEGAFAVQATSLGLYDAQKALAIGATAPPMQVETGNVQMKWQVVDDWHPDFREASVDLNGGRHEIVFSNVPTGGWPILASLNGMSLSNVTAVQGRNPGRRMLLGKPQTIPGAVNFATTAGQHSLSFNQPNSFAVLDLGRIVHGRIEAVVQGGKGTLIDIGWDERLWRDAHPLPHPGSLHPQWTQVDSWVLDGTSRRISTIDSRTGRYVLIAVWGNAPVQITNLRVIEERYPVVQSPAPDFGDATLNAIWRVGRDTALLNMTDAYADPWRERGQWWGDATVVDAVNTAVFNDNALMRRGLLFMAEQFQQMPSPAMAPHGPHAGDLLDYAMLWVQGIRNYVDRTGDTTLVQECYPAIKKFMAHVASFENKQTGLLDMPKLGWWQTAFIDWSAHYNPGGSLSHGQSTPLNAMYYGTLMDAGALAALMGDSAQSEAWTARAGRVRDSINTALYLPDQKRYASSIIDGAVVPPTLFAQAWPLAYGVTPADRQKDVADALLGLISKEPSQPNVQPYGMHWVLKALGDAGRTKEAFNLIKLYYSYMLDRGATTWWETWDADQVYSKSLSHGWGSAPTWFISKYASQIPSVASLHAKTTPQKENTE